MIREKRRRNNEAARRSREKKRNQEMELEQRVLEPGVGTGSPGPISGLILKSVSPGTGLES